MSTVPQPGTVEPLDMDQVKIDPAWALRVPPALAVRRQILPFTLVDGHVCIACLQAQDAATMQALQRYLQNPVKLYPAEPASLKRALDRVFGSGNETRARQPNAPVRTGNVDPRSASDPEGEDTVALCEELIYAALIRQASDMHLDPTRDGMQVRFRVDGVLEPYRKLPSAVHAGIISRFKVLAGMDIADKRSPQDGRFTHKIGAGDPIDVRVASLPTRHGERMTLRLLAVQTAELTLERLGFNPGDLDQFQQAIERPHGLILITGPTGSGKTTTLYAGIRRLIAGRSLNVITIEDPIEYEIGGVAQVEVDAGDRVSFAKALRSLLRHDPDIVMIGEIRDRETADVAIKAALTGHLVFSTLHTNSAVSAVTRLADMGVDRYLIAATLRLAIAQRLVRKLCQHCRTPEPLAEREAIALGRPDLAGETVYRPQGCLYCAGRGYVGRLGVFELFPVDAQLSRAVADNLEEGELAAELRKQKIPTLADDGVEKMLGGKTSVSEILAAVTMG
jgi:type IV pilus assembly protein PilB